MSPSIILQRPGANWARHHPDTDKTAGRLSPDKKTAIDRKKNAIISKTG